MTNYYDQAYSATMETEGHGKWTNHKLDPGKETYSGISRVHHPGWRGWSLIDLYLREGKPIDTERLEPMVREFYRYVFWHPIAGDRLAELSPAIALKVFDTAVNVGVEKASTWLQEALNLLNRNQRIYPDLLPDGDIGNETMGALKIALESRPPAKAVTEARILKIMTIKFGSRWIYLMEKHPQREEFRGIYDRV